MQRRALLEQLSALTFAPPSLFGRRDTGARFDTIADQALSAMREQATNRGVQGVAVVAFLPGASLVAWSSKMLVVGHYKQDSSGADKGANLLGIAYAKASEMADTHRKSGSHLRPPLTGEFGWTGGAIAQTANGYVLAAFSGGKDADDLAISQAGVAILAASATKFS